MLDKKILEKLASKFQTSDINVLREYTQHLFLSSLYRISGSERLLFKGGTAFRLGYKSPRFSEDLDFTGQNINYSEIEDLIFSVKEDLVNQGIKYNIDEAKKTLGGYLSKLSVDIYGKKITTMIQISFRNGKTKEKNDIVEVANEYIPTYIATFLSLDAMVKEKIQASLTRSKPRDFYDVYFLIRQNLVNNKDKETLLKLKNIIMQKDIQFGNELSIFLPRSMKSMAESFPKPLILELERL